MNDIHPIKNVIDISVFTPNQIIGFWVFVVFLLCVILFFMYKKFFKKSESVEKLDEVIEEEPIDYSLEAKEGLKKAQVMIDEKNYKEFYLEITLIIKNYIDGVNKINTRDLTTKEIFNHQNLSSDIKEKLKIFFETIDLAKFADQKLDHENANKVYELASNFIKGI